MEYIHLNIGEVVVRKGVHVTFSCLGLSTCIGLFIQDRSLNLTGGAHIFLPTFSGDESETRYYTAFDAINAIIRQFKAYGSDTIQLRAKISGGADFTDSFFSVGKLNAEAVTRELVLKRVYIAASDTGGSTARSVQFESDTGRMIVHMPLTKEIKIF